MTDGQAAAPEPASGPQDPWPDAERPFRSAAEWAAHLRWRALATPKASIGDHVREAVAKPIDKLEDLIFPDDRTTIVDQFVANGFRILNDFVQRSRSSDAVIERYREQHTQVRSLADIRALPLEAIEAARPTWLSSYDVAAAVSGGLGGLIGLPGTIVAVPTLFYASLHAIGSYALHFGHDLTDLDEQEFAVTLLATSLVARPSTRIEVVRSLEATAQALESESPDDADPHRIAILGNVAEAVVLRFLLGAVVRGMPGVGLLLGAGFSRVFVAQVCETALAAYEQRWLFRRYGDAARLVTAG